MKRIIHNNNPTNLMNGLEELGIVYNPFIEFETKYINVHYDDVGLDKSGLSYVFYKEQKDEDIIEIFEQFEDIIYEKEYHIGDYKGTIVIYKR